MREGTLRGSGGGTVLASTSWRRPAILGAVAVALGAGAIGWHVRRKGPGESNADIVAFGRAVCLAVVGRDWNAYRALHVMQGDLNLDGSARYVAYPGASFDDFAPWEQRVRATFEAAAARLSANDGITCGAVTFKRPENPSEIDDRDGLIDEMTVALGDATERTLHLGPSVRSQRGRVFHGMRNGAFVGVGAPVHDDGYAAAAVAESPTTAVAESPTTAAAQPQPTVDDQGDDGASLRRKLRSDDRFAAMSAKHELSKRRLSIDFDRYRPMGDDPDRPEDSSSALAFEAELDGDDIVVRWNAWFGPQLFDGSEVRHYYEISVHGGTLASEAKHRGTPTAGENAGEVVIARGVGAGEYAIGLFLWSRRPSDGLQLSNNAAAVFLTKR